MQDELTEKKKGIPGRRERMSKGKTEQKALIGRVSPSEHALWDRPMLLVVMHTHSFSVRAMLHIFEGEHIHICACSVLHSR